MARGACFLVELAEGTPVREAGRHILALRECLGPTAAVDVAGTGERPGELQAGVRLLGRGGARAVTAAAMRGAGTSHLVVLLGNVLPDPAAVQGLLSAFELDAMAAFVTPRFSDSTRDDVWSLPDGRREPAPIPRQALPLLPSFYVTTEHLAACLAIRADVAAEFASSLETSGGVAEAIVELMYRARRCGYRHVVSNRVVVASSEPPERLYPTLEPRQEAAFQTRFPDVRTATASSAAPHHRFERVAARARRRSPRDRLPVLLDCRGAQAHHNGTSEAIVGILDGLAAAAPAWRVDLVFNEAAARFHDVLRRYPTMELHTTIPQRTFAAAVLLDQPWSLSHVAELHRSAFSVAFNILDTIAWDVGYLANPEVERTWRFVAEHADGLLYISSFTQARFDFRFRVAPAVVQQVAHLSLDPAEHRDERVAARPGEDHILVFGNHYDHKAVASTVELLSRAFPFQRFRVLGPVPDQLPNVTGTPSGKLPASEIEHLVATARLVVFPSHYEGFGLPVMKALAYGRTVIVRSSPLWKEMAGSTRAPGRMVEFATRPGLVEAVGRALAGEALEALPLGGDLGGAPPGWRECAQRVLTLVERIAASDSSRWFARDRALGLAGL